MGNPGIVYHSQGDYPLAVHYHTQAVAVAWQIGDRRSEGKSLSNLGLTIYSLGDRTTAISHLTAALDIFERIQSPYAERVRDILADWRHKNSKSVFVESSMMS